MNRALHLIITTPARVLVDADKVVSIRAEDRSGSFGILPGHADLLTVLVPSVVRWRLAGGTSSFCAVRGGVFTVAGGGTVAIACREAAVGDSLEGLEAQVSTIRAEQLEAARKVHVRQVRAHAFAVRQLVRYLRSNPAELAPIDEERVS